MRDAIKMSGVLTVVLLATVVLGSTVLVGCNGQSSKPTVKDTGYWRSKLATGDYEAIKDLQQMGVEALPMLQSFLSDSDAQVVMQAAALIGRLGEQAAPAVPDLLQAMKREDVRGRVEYALQDLGKAAMMGLIAGLKSPDPEVKKYATKVMSRGLDKDWAPALDPLIAIAKSGAPEQVRINAILAIAAIGSPAMAKGMPLMQELSTKGGEIGKQAQRAYKRLEVANRPGAYSDSR